MQDEKLLDVQDLRVEFATRHGTLVALDGVSFSIARGEVLGIVGESGAGKSMTGNAVMGLLEKPGRITGGKIFFEGKRIDNYSGKEMEKLRGKYISSIFQDPLTSLNPLFTIEDQLVETILEHLDIDTKAAKEKALDLLVQAGIPAPQKRLSQYPHQFSGGMRQRVVIALALATSPQLLIADEPTTALDVSVQAQIISLLKKLCREKGTAIMLVTHDMGVIAEISDRVAVMYAGHLVEIGNVKDVIHAPLHPYTVGLMGSIPKIGKQEEKLMQIPGAMPPLTAIPSGCPFHPRCALADERCRKERPPMREFGTTCAACWHAGESENFHGLFAQPTLTVRTLENMP